MNASREILGDQLEKYEAQVKSLSSYIKELSDRTAEYGTDKAQFQEDLFEAEHNVEYYTDEIARIKKEIGDLDKAARKPNKADAVLPQTMKQGLGSLIFSSIGFMAGAILGARLKARRDCHDTPQGKRED